MWKCTEKKEKSSNKSKIMLLAASQPDKQNNNITNLFELFRNGSLLKNILTMLMLKLRGPHERAAS